MKFDRNTVLGFLILGILFIAYFWYNNQQIEASRKAKAVEQHRVDSINAVQARLNKPKEDSLTHIQDSAIVATKKGTFFGTADTTEKLVVIQTNLLSIAFTNKGGQVKYVDLKNYRRPDSSLVRMAGSSFDNFSYSINTGTSAIQETSQTSELYFPMIDSSHLNGADGTKTISFTLRDSIGRSITHEYVVRPNDYLIDLNIKIEGANSLLTNGNMNLQWNYGAAQQERSLSYEKQNTQVGFVKSGGSFDYFTTFKHGGSYSKDFNDPVKWVGVRQRFFMGALVAKNNFSAGSRMAWETPADSAKMVAVSTSTLKVSVPAGAPSVIPFSLYYGPSDYHTLKKYDLGFQKLVNLGQGVYSFVRPLNRFIFLPIFDFFKSFAGSMGLTILLLTIFIRLLISPLTYTSYLSGAKMKALRPELAQLKEKIGDDRQAMSVEQMKLFREAGVNPLGGCIPALLQIPIFFALFSFFNSCVDLRGASFLWASDLSAPDTVIHFGTNIPLLGDHLSLFNVTACLTSFLISWYSMSMTPDQSNPVMKYMPYIFPIFLLFFFNRLPAGLTWYYTVSNLITLGLQFVIQNYIIDHDKVLAKIAENRKKPKVKSKWQERMEQIQEQQKRMKEAQQKGRR
jgi:YidC/Oxa1 family membrane protein insertase